MFEEEKYTDTTTLNKQILVHVYFTDAITIFVRNNGNRKECYEEIYFFFWSIEIAFLILLKALPSKLFPGKGIYVAISFIKQSNIFLPLT